MSPRFSNSSTTTPQKRLSVDELAAREGAIRSDIRKCLATLLQTKHLYQSLAVGISSLLPELLPVHASTPLDPGLFDLAKRVQGPWTFPQPTLDAAARTIATRGQPRPLQIEAPSDLKLLCAPCDRVEPANLIFSADCLDRGGIADTTPKTIPGTIQLFTLSYLCQSCKAVPHVFLLRREHSKLTICGRAPMEHVPSPPEIPKAVRGFFSSACLAHQSGQTLAGVFFLRTLIEQWVLARVAPEKLRADKALERYYASLPTDFRARFPSLRETYSELSDAIHAATASAALYENATKQILKHFVGFRAFELGPGAA